jgi:hypothetical protein
MNRSFQSGQLNAPGTACFRSPANQASTPGRRRRPIFQSIALNFFSDTDVWSACAEHQLQRSYTGQWLKTPLDLKIREEEGEKPGVWPEAIESREKIFLRKGERVLGSPQFR